MHVVHAISNHLSVLNSYLRFLLISADEISPNSTSDASAMLDSPKSPDDINNDRYHMLSGICVEALCSQLVSYSDEDLCYFLMSIEALLETELGRQRLTHEKVNKCVIYLQDLSSTGIMCL